jgi:hypothetical protein
MVDPKTTILLLDKLEELGFHNEAFAAIHHFKEKGRADTIAEHRAYCIEKDSFQDGRANARIQQRLKLVLTAYQLGGFQSGKAEVFRCLAEAAYNEITSKHHD